MEWLEEDCVKYVAAHLQDIVKLQIDLSCLTPKIVKQISINSSVSQFYFQDWRHWCFERQKG